MFWRKKKRDTDSHGRALGFSMYAESAMERYRADTFFEKEPETLVWLYRIKGDAMLVDVGANIGVYSLHLAALRPDVPIYAFEPVWENFTRLVDNINLNGCKNITPINAGLSNEPGIIKFYQPSVEVGASGGQLYAPVKESGEMFHPKCIRQIITLSFDSFMDRLPINRPVHLKIDVDGQEWTILKGIKKHAPCIESVLVEINKKSTKLQDVALLMRSWGLRPDDSINNFKPHSSDRRGGDPVNIVFTRGA